MIPALCGTHRNPSFPFSVGLVVLVQLAQRIVSDANDAVARNEAGGEHRLAILINGLHEDIKRLLEQRDGNNKRRRDRIKEKALLIDGGVC